MSRFSVGHIVLIFPSKFIEKCHSICFSSRTLSNYAAGVCLVWFMWPGNGIVKNCCKKRKGLQLKVGEIWSPFPSHSFQSCANKSSHKSLLSVRLLQTKSTCKLTFTQLKLLFKFILLVIEKNLRTTFGCSSFRTKI